MKISPVTNGNQNSVTIHCSCKYLATDFTKPDEKIKLTDNAAPIKSVARLPSIYENTIPQVMPKGNPLMKRKIILTGAGTMAKKNRASQDVPTRIRSIFHRPVFLSSAINFIP